MITDADLTRIEGMSAQAILAEGGADAGILMGAAIVLFEKFSAQQNALVFAIMFGTLCAEQEGKPCISDTTGLVDFEQRIQLFTTMARTVYREALCNVQTSGPRH